MSVTMTGYPRCQAPGHNNIMGRDDKQNCYHSRITDGHTLVTGIHLNPRPSLQREHPHSHNRLQTRPGVQQCQAQGLVFCP